MLGEAGGTEASLRWRSIHKNYFYLFLHEKTTGDKVGIQWWGGRRGGGIKERSPAETSAVGWEPSWKGLGALCARLPWQEQGLGGDDRAFQGWETPGKNREKRGVVFRLCGLSSEGRGALLEEGQLPAVM